MAETWQGFGDRLARTAEGLASKQVRLPLTTTQCQAQPDLRNYRILANNRFSLGTFRYGVALRGEIAQQSFVTFQTLCIRPG